MMKTKIEKKESEEYDSLYVYASLYYTYDGVEYRVDADTHLKVNTTATSPAGTDYIEPEEHAAENTEKFYYTADGTNVNVSMTGELDFNDFGDKNLVIACYDKGALVNTRLIPLGEMVNGAELNPFTIKLDKVPEELTVKALAWSSLGDVNPICNAANLTDIPKNAHHIILLPAEV